MSYRRQDRQTAETKTVQYILLIKFSDICYVKELGQRTTWKIV